MKPWLWHIWCIHWTQAMLHAWLSQLPVVELLRSNWVQLAFEVSDKSRTSESMRKVEIDRDRPTFHQFGVWSAKFQTHQSCGLIKWLRHSNTLPQPSSIVHVEFQSAHGVSYTLQPKEVPAMANVSIPLLAMVQPVAAFNSACLDRIGQTMRPIVGRIDRPLGAKAFVRQLATSCHVLPCPALSPVRGWGVLGKIRYMIGSRLGKQVMEGMERLNHHLGFPHYDVGMAHVNLGPQHRRPLESLSMVFHLKIVGVSSSCFVAEQPCTVTCLPLRKPGRKATAKQVACAISPALILRKICKPQTCHQLLLTHDETSDIVE